ncbi:MAG: hypothetical protein U0V72_06695, partial [Cytophagales bacterium]
MIQKIYTRKIILFIAVLLLSTYSTLAQKCACNSTYGLSCTATPSNQAVPSTGLNFMEGNWFINGNVTINNPVKMGNGPNGNVNQSGLKICSGSNVVLNQFEFNGANQFHTLEVDEGATLEIFLTSSSLDRIKIVNNGTLIIHAPTSDNKLDFRNNLNQFFNNGTLVFVADEVIEQVATGFTNAGVLLIRGRNNTSGGNLTFVNSNQKICMTGGSVLDIQGYITSTHDSQIGYGGETNDKATVTIRGKDAAGYEIDGQLNNVPSGFFKDLGNNFVYNTSDGTISLPPNFPSYKVSTGTASTNAGICTTLGDCIPVFTPITYTVTAKNANCGSADGSLTFSGLQPNTPYTITYFKNGIAQTGSFTTNSSGVGVISGLTAGTFTGIQVNRGCLSKLSNETYVIKDSVPNMPSVAIVANKDSICAGQSITYSISSQLNQGTNPTYTWYKNGTIISGATGTTYTTSNILSTDTIMLKMGVSSTCVVASSVNSNKIKIKVNPIPDVNSISNFNLCNKNTLTGFNFTGTVPNTTFNWTNTLTSIGLAASGTNSIPTFSVINTGSTNLISTVTVTPISKGCSGTAKSFTITVTPSPVVQAGADQTVCSNNSQVKINGSVSKGSSTGIWTGLGGSFGSSASTLSNTYTPSSLEILTTFTQLILTSTNNGNCTAVSDTLNLFFSSSPTADAGVASSVCANNAQINLNPTTSDADVFKWTTSGTGLFFPSDNVEKPQYQLSAADTLAGSVKLKLSANNSNPPCKAVVDSVIITVNPSPKVSAGADVQICKNNPVTSLIGSSTTGSGVWSLSTGASGTLTVDPSNALKVSYKASAAELNAGTPIRLRFTSSNNGGCNAVFDEVSISFIAAPTITVDKGKTVCENNPSLSLNASSSTGSLLWSGFGGSINPSTSSSSITYTLSTAEISAKQAKLVVSTSNNGLCAVVKDSTLVLVTSKPLVNAGSDVQVCANASTANIVGTVQNASGGVWSHGGGSYGSSNSTLTNTYTPSASELSASKALLILTSTGNGLCKPVSDTLQINIKSSPSVNAGNDQTVCVTASSVSLQGSSSNSTAVQWRTLGTGTFGNANAAVTTYSPSAADKNAGGVTLELMSTNNTTCIEDSNQVNIIFTDSPKMTIGNDQTVCANDFPVQLSATGTPASWIGGNGTFSPDRNTLNATYTPTAGELSAGSVTLTLESNNVNACAKLSETLTITLKPAPVVDLGTTQTICANSNQITVSANSANVSWRSLNGSGSFSPTTGASVTYTASSNDLSRDSLVFVGTSTNNNGCSSVSDTVLYKLQQPAQVNAGPDRSVCANNPKIKLNGTIIGKAQGTWSGGSGSFSNVNDLEASYTPSASESGSVTLTLSIAAAGSCPAETDQMTLSITPAPTLSLSGAQTICADVDSARVNATTNAVAGGVLWSTSGSGIFSSSSAIKTPDYYFSAADASAGSVKLYASTTSSGSCLEVKDSLTLTIQAPPQIQVGADTVICADLKSLPLKALLVNATGATWTTDGGGSFASASGINNSYQISATDRSKGLFTITATTTGTGLCKSVSDAQIIQVKPAPTVYAGNDRSLCTSADTLNLLAKVSIAGGTGTWKSTGSGSFSTASSLQTFYTLSAADKAKSNFEIIYTATFTGQGYSCNPISDTLQVTIAPTPTLDLGNAISVCSDSSLIPLSASYTGATGIRWSSKGSGSFTPNTLSDSPQYTPSSTESAGNHMFIYAVTTGNGVCNPVTDSVQINFTKQVVVDAGLDINICQTAQTVTLKGFSQNSADRTWNTAGTGSFSPSNKADTVIYTLSADDKQAGKVIFNLSTQGFGTCIGKLDQMQVNIEKAATVDAGADKVLCTDNSVVTLVGKAQNTSQTTWSTLADGVFNNNIQNLNNSFSIGAVDFTQALDFVLTAAATANCPEVKDTLQVRFTPKPTLTLQDAYNICQDVNTVSIFAHQTVASGLKWNVKGTGTIANSAIADTLLYTLSSADKTNGIVEFVVTTTGNGLCKAISDSTSILLTPTVEFDAGSDIVTCADQFSVALSTTLSTATGVKWETTGSGTFAPNDSTINPIYQFSPEDSASGSVTIVGKTTGNGTCLEKSDAITITLNPVPIVSAGTDISTCFGADSIRIDAYLKYASKATWSSSGTGSFVQGTDTSFVYYRPSATDYTDGTVVIFLEPQEFGLCNQYTSNVSINFTSVPSIEAGISGKVCSTDLPVQLSASGANSRWIGNGGTFEPSEFALNAIYTPTAAEIATGVIKLHIETIKQKTCTQGVDSVEFIVTPGPVVEAGFDTTQSCANNSTVQLSAATNNGVSATVAWRTATGEGTFIPNAQTLNATFVPSANQIKNGIARLFLESTSNGNCSTATDMMIVQIAPAPTIVAFDNYTICADVNAVSVEARITGAANVAWTSTGTGTFGAANALTSTYNLSSADKTTGNVQLIASTQNAGTCLNVTDTLLVKVTQAPTVDALSGFAVCNSTNILTLHAQKTVAKSLEWTSTGTGTFTKGINADTVLYEMSTADAKAGTVRFKVATQQAGTCITQFDSLVVQIDTLPLVVAGPDTAVCSASGSFPISALSSAPIVWSGGTGTIEDNTATKTKYILTTTDVSKGSVVLTVTTNQAGTCPEAKDFTIVQISPLPLVETNFGSDISICKDNQGIDVSGVVKNADGGTWSVVKGNGAFVDSTALSTRYIFGASETNTAEVILQLTSVGNGYCNAASDSLKVSFTPTPVVNAGTDQTVCEDTTALPLTASYTVSSDHTWSTTGDGVFSPNIHAKNITYSPGPNDLLLQNTLLILTAQNNGTCIGNYADTIDLNIISKPTVDLGADKVVCSNSTSVPLTASTENATSITWSSSGTGTFSSANFNTNYSLTAADIKAGAVGITAVVQGNSLCKAVRDQQAVSINLLPTVNAGPTQLYCANATAIKLKGSSQNGTSSSWVSTGTGTFSPSANQLSSTYVPSATDKNKSSLTFTLTTQGKTACPAVKSTTLVTLQALPTASVGDFNMCTYLTGIHLSGTVTGAKGGKWSTAGTGVFAPSTDSLSTVYHLSQSDKSKSEVLLTLTTTGNGVCAATSDTSSLFIRPLPVADAGIDQVVCKNTSATLSALIKEDIIDYTWNNISNMTATGNTAVVNTPQLNATNDFELRVLNAFGCTDTDTVRVEIIDTLGLALIPHYCYENELEIRAQVPTSSYPATFQWFNDKNLIKNATDTSYIVALGSGKYIITYTVDKCTFKSETNVTDPPIMYHRDRIACENSSLRISVNYLPKVTYTWATGVADSNTSLITVLPDTNFYRVSAVDPLNCSSKDSVQVIGIEKPQIVVVDTAFCLNQSAPLSYQYANQNNLSQYTQKGYWTTPDTVKSTLPITVSKA